MPTRPAARRPTSRRSVTRLARPQKRRRRTVSADTIPGLSYLRVAGAWDRQRVVALLLFLVVGWILLQCFTTSNFLVGAPTVSGNKGLATSEIVEATKPVQGRNIFWVDPQEAWQAVMKLPGVKEAQVRLELPNRLFVEIKDQEPQIVWEARGVQYLVTGNGEVIRPGNATGNFLLITDPNPKADALASGKWVDKRAISTVQQLDKLMPKQIKSYEWSQNGGITILSQEGWRAAIGWDDNLEAKVEIIRATVKRAAERHEAVKLIDVRAPERPSVK